MECVVTRRDFLKTVSAAAAAAAIGGLPSSLTAGEMRLVTFPEKTELILLTSRPPQLETPLHYFKHAVTPNEALFVRWHMSNFPKSVDLNTWKLRIGGNVESPYELTFDDMQKFEKVTYTAVLQCAGNGRSFFNPRVFGAQWANGSMGNITWTGARLRDILNKAGIKPGSVQISIDGLDGPPVATVSDFVKSLPLDKALEEDILVAYEMNGTPLLMLNGFPARIIVPRLVRHLLGQMPQGDQRPRQTLRRVLDEDGLPDPRQPVRLRAPRLDRREDRPHHEDDDAVRHRRTGGRDHPPGQRAGGNHGDRLFRRVRHQGGRRFDGRGKDMGRGEFRTGHGTLFMDPVVLPLSAGKARAIHPHGQGDEHHRRIAALRRPLEPVGISLEQGGKDRCNGAIGGKR